ncbi:MAG: hypothetical protein ACOC6C_07020, partial [Verrucomicrobiota bacterium]
YDFSIYERFRKLAKEHRVFPLFGMEIIARDKELLDKGIRINDPANPGKLYICGKGLTDFNPMSPRGDELIKIIRRNDSERMRQMTDKLSSFFARKGIPVELSAEKIIGRLQQRYRVNVESIVLQERHIAQAFQEAVFEQVPLEQRAESLSKVFGDYCNESSDDPCALQGTIRSHLMKAGKPCFVEETFVRPDQARELILETGGIVCYPVLADGASQRTEYETPVSGLIERLQEQGIRMVEFIPVRNSKEVLMEYVPAIREAGIAAVAGTEHNSPKLLPLEPDCSDGQKIPDEINRIFREGACIIAAHQSMNLQGKCGFTDKNGSLNPEYGNIEDCIRDLSGIGKDIIERRLAEYE